MAPADELGRVPSLQILVRAMSLSALPVESKRDSGFARKNPRLLALHPLALAFLETGNLDELLAELRPIASRLS